jgi:hypothetical protein
MERYKITEGQPVSLIVQHIERLGYKSNTEWNNAIQSAAAEYVGYDIVCFPHNKLYELHSRCSGRDIDYVQIQLKEKFCIKVSKSQPLDKIEDYLQSLGYMPIVDWNEKKLLNSPDFKYVATSSLGDYYFLKVSKGCPKRRLPNVYPYLGHSVSGRTVLFTGDSTGVIVNDNGGFYEVGHQSGSWSEKYFRKVRIEKVADA